MVPEESNTGTAALGSTPTEAPHVSFTESQQGPADKAQEVAGRVQEQAQSVMGQTQDRVRDQVDQRSTQLGEQLRQQASDLRAVSDSLREQGKTGPAQAAERIAGYAEQAGSYLRDKPADAILSDVERVGRERPGAMAAGALALGFVASRMLKASSSRRYHGGQYGRPAAGTAPRTLSQARPVSDPLSGVGDPLAGVGSIGSSQPAYPPPTPTVTRT